MPKLDLLDIDDYYEDDENIQTRRDIRRKRDMKMSGAGLRDTHKRTQDRSRRLRDTEHG